MPLSQINFATKRNNCRLESESILKSFLLSLAQITYPSSYLQHIVRDRHQLWSIPTALTQSSLTKVSLNMELMFCNKSHQIQHLAQI